MIITISGSTKFKDEMLEWAKYLTKLGFIVLMPFVFAHYGDTITEQEKEMLDNLHKQRIDLSDGVLVINVGGYIGKSTASEIEYAKSKNKIIRYLELIEGKEDLSTLFVSCGGEF